MYSTKLLPKFIFTIILILTFTNFSFGEESENYIIMLDGTKIECYGNISLSAEFVSFDNSEGKSKSIRQKKIKLMLIHNRLFLNLNISKNMKRMQEVYAFNSDYIMTGYWQSATYIYIWDKEFTLINGKISFFPGFTKKKIKKNQLKYNEEIAKYFKDCEELSDALNKNIGTGKSINSGISYYRCKDAKLNPLTSYLNLKE